MKKAFERILERLEEECVSPKDYPGYVIDLEKANEIVQGAEKEYNYLAEGFNSGLLNRIADYFSSVYEGDDKTAPKMELSVYELREIASLHVEKCRLQAEINNSKQNNGWILCSERLPDNDRYILLSFDNFSIPCVGRYEEDKTGGAFYIGDEDETCISQELYVNAWQPLPNPFRTTSQGSSQN